MVVMNERADLENTFSSNTREAYDQIKELKKLESQILSQMEGKIENLLTDSSLINTLIESKNTAEYVAMKLKEIQSTNQFIEKSREVYQPIAFRASTLFFLAQDLRKINPKYFFSLDWFKKVMRKSLEMTNPLKDNLF